MRRQAVGKKQYVPESFDKIQTHTTQSIIHVSNHWPIQPPLCYFCTV